MATPAEGPSANRASSDASDSEPDPGTGAVIPSFPCGRVKRIMKLDGEINKVNSEALFLISLSAELFLEFLAEGAGNAASRKRRKTIKLEHLRTAVIGHTPTSDFLLDCIPEVELPPRPTDRKRGEPEKPLPAGMQKIDGFFSKQVETAQ